MSDTAESLALELLAEIAEDRMLRPSQRANARDGLRLLREAAEADENGDAWHKPGPIRRQPEGIAADGGSVQ